jgi:malonate decarboxylase delta subunit
METIQFEYPASSTAQGRALAGVVGSGDLEVLVEAALTGKTSITVNTSVDGGRHMWKDLFDRIFASQQVPAVSMEINDFGATPGVVHMRIDQALELLAQSDSTNVKR